MKENPLRSEYKHIPEGKASIEGGMSAFKTTGR